MPGAANPVDHATAGVDQYRHRDGIGAEHVFQEQVAVMIIVERDLGLPEEGRGRLGMVVGRDADDIELLAAIPARQPLERSHFRAAGAAPAGPDVDDQGLPAQLVQLAVVAGESV